MKKAKLHLVQLDKNVLYNWRYEENKHEILYANIKNYRFMSYLENISCSNLYFRPKEDSEEYESLMIVPHAWVKWCVPINEE